MRVISRALSADRGAALRPTRRLSPHLFTVAPRFFLLIIGIAATEVNILWGFALFGLALVVPLDAPLMRRAARGMAVLGWPDQRGIYDTHRPTDKARPHAQMEEP